MDGFGMNDNYNNQSNEMSGVYTPQNQFDFNPDMLAQLGFNAMEIQTFAYIMSNGGKTSLNALTQYGISYEEAKKIRYMQDICIGKVIIDSTDDLAKHMRKMFGSMKRIGITDLAVSKIKKVERKAVVAGIQDATYSIYNSKQYPFMERMYNVVDVTGQRIFIETLRKPVLKYKQSKYVEGVLEITELKKDGSVVVAINKQYCRLVNRFVIVGSLRKPEFHHGLIQIICIEGTKLYIYAKSMGIKESINYNMGTERVYSYGFYNQEIKNKLKEVGALMYKHVCGVYASSEPANQDFQMLTDDSESSNDTDEIVIED